MLRRRLLIAAAALPLAATAAESGGPIYNDSLFGIDLPAGYVGPVEHVAGAAVSRAANGNGRTAELADGPGIGSFLAGKDP